ncbi:hypothetical protein NP233_g1582 [Leucocoprinus birnbaumii]|uniref:F-box domain-containing protein n=1 Tax=Leucocoprinus birnbaumii TaxID=56174 RepID=A0AAD5W5F9_9AGAR|nr:hypothetical protein NP233_g1582 [Leucocoprinus birnbaumii]
MSLLSRLPGAPRDSDKAPIDRLPADVLIEVFQFASSSFLGLYGSRNAICAVCRTWREIAIGFSGLWTEINIDVAVCFPPVPLLEMWLERSGDASLDIDLTCLFHLFTVRLEKHHHWQRTLSVLPREKVKLYAASVIPVLTQHIRRWRHFSYMVISAPGDGAHNASLLMQLPFRDAGRLEVLKLVTKTTPTAELDLLGVAAEAPNIRRLHWSTSSRSRLPANEALFPWHQLHHVSLHGNSKHVSPVVAWCTSAVSLNLLADICFPLQKQPQMSCVLPALRGLNLQCYLDGLRLLREIECPNLEILRISIMTQEDFHGMLDNEEDDDDEIYWDHILSFLFDSNHRLRILQIEEKEEMIQLDFLEKIFSGPSRLTKELYALELVLDYSDGSAHDTIRTLQQAWDSEEDKLPGALLDRYELTAFGDEFLHVGWVREECEPFLKRSVFARDVGASMEPFERLSNLERADP